jgi:hypothetical protein
MSEDKNVISDEVIVAGAKAMDAYWGGRYEPNEVEELRGEITAILEAVTPLIAAKALEEAADALDDLRMARSGVIKPGTWEYFEMLPIQHIRDRAEQIRGEQ